MKSIGMVVALAILCWRPAVAETPEQILALTEKAADWQLRQLNGDVPSAQAVSESPRGWVYGTLYSGLTALADVAPEPRFADAVISHGLREGWALGNRDFHADDYVIGRSWVWSYQRTRDPKAIEALKTRLDMIIAAKPSVSLDYGTNPPPHVESACQVRWCWADALFMGPPTFAALTRATGDDKYLAFADSEFWVSTEFLFDKDENLFARDSRFFVRRGPDAEKIFWSRGNGWVYAGIVQMLQFLPANHPSRARYIALFRKMSERLVTLQKPDGYWPVSLLSRPEGTPPETSGTAFYTYGLAYGVREGILKDPIYRTAALHGWHALEAAIQPDGMLGWVQKIGFAPDAVKAEDTQLYGVGALLLAGSEIYRLARKDARHGRRTQ